MRVSRTLHWALLGGLLLALLLVPILRPLGPPPPLLASTTTSLVHTGLLDSLASNFTRETGTRMYFIPVGSGQAIELARRGDVDMALTHDPDLELAMVAEGYFTRTPFATNRFQVVGPPADPAGVRGLDAAGTFRAIHDRNATFVSRGDRSGTHAREQLLWKGAGYNYTTEISVPSNAWYLSAGAGMGATLQKAFELGAYTLTDEGTYRSYRGRLDLDVLNPGDEPAFLNTYSVLLLNETRFPGKNHTPAKAFAEWLLSERGLGMVGAFGDGLFRPFRYAREE
ncbi:MAG: substrate-binding domain-containing protein [Halobacteria archaeon]